MSKLTREVKQKRFRTPQATKKIIHKLVDEVEAMERKLEKSPTILLPNFGIIHVTKEDIPKEDVIVESSPEPVIKKSYCKKEEKNEEKKLG